MIEQLRERTKKSHQELDHMLFPFIQSVQTRAEYEKLLKVFYGFFRPMQDVFDRYIDESVVPGYNSRRKPEWILKDLESIQVPPGDFELCQELPPVAGRSSALGAFYVLEGSSMGGTIISRKIGSQLDLTDNQGLAFFNAYGNSNHRMWNEFLSALADYSEKEHATEEIIRSAENTFTSFRKWIIRNYAAGKPGSESPRY